VVRHRFFLMFFLLSAAGCGGSAAPQAEVSGTVTYRGKPLPGGIITFVSDRGLQNSAVISPDGRYQIKVATGATKVTIDNRMLRKGQQATGPRLKNPNPSAEPPPSVDGTYVPLSPKYLSADQSGLTCEIQKGSQVRDFQLGPM
jgi:hypothetical protein